MLEIDKQPRLRAVLTAEKNAAISRYVRHSRSSVGNQPHSVGKADAVVEYGSEVNVEAGKPAPL